MADECIFCKIAAGDIPSYTLYEDDTIKAFLDVFPVTKGHTVVIPKKHIADFGVLESDDADFLKLLPQLINGVKRMTGADGVNVWQNNGKAAGQEIPHLHFHIVPRFEGDGLFKFPPQGKLQEGDAQKLVSAFSV